MNYLTIEDVIWIINDNNWQIREFGLLESAIIRPQSSYQRVDAYKTLSLKASALFHSVLMNHALIDGNKRLAWILLELFVNLNDKQIMFDNMNAYKFTMNTIEKRLSVEEINRILELQIL